MREPKTRVEFKYREINLLIMGLYTLCREGEERRLKGKLERAAIKLRRKVKDNG